MKILQLTKCQLHVSEAACLLGCSSMKVYGLIHTKQLNAHKEGKAWKIHVDDLTAYMDSLKSR